MIKNILDSMNDYSMSHSKVSETYNLTMDYINKNYVKGGAIYNTEANKAAQMHKEALAPLTSNYMETVTKTIESARQALKKAVAKSPTAEQLHLIAMVKDGAVKDSEKAYLLEAVKDNYFASRLMRESLGMEDEDTIGELQGAIDDLEKVALNFVTDSGKPNNDYLTRNVLQGEWISEVDSVLNSIVETYGKGVNE